MLNSGKRREKRMLGCPDYLMGLNIRILHNIHEKLHLILSLITELLCPCPVVAN